MPESIDVSFHEWPWSVDVEGESHPAAGEKVEFPFYGSPVLSVKASQVFLSSRHEKFIPLGPSFFYGTQVYEVPHGVLSQSSSGRGDLMIISDGHRRQIDLGAKGAKGRVRDDGKKETSWALTILGWSQFFDNLLDDNADGRIETGKIAWALVLKFLLQQKDEIRQPRMSLIVRIAEELHSLIPETVARMRRILVRERNMQRIDRICETDVRCLQWYSKQPGADMAQKGGSKQELLAVVRRESYDVLENRVLKDFLRRCDNEAMRYINGEIDINPNFSNAKRAMDVRRFREICARSAKHPNFQLVPRAGAGARPNYVLQNDLRYRKIWTWYCRLLRKEEEEDRFWDWQTRTWADIVRLLVNLAIVSMENEKPKRNGIRIRPALGSSLRVTREQILGGRTHGGSEPGPFIIEKVADGVPRPVGILEVVHPDEASEHMLARNLSRTGGHLYLAVRPLGESADKNNVIVIWGVNTAGSDLNVSWERVSESAMHALGFHRIALATTRIPHLPCLQGIVAASALNTKETEVIGEASTAPVVIVPADPRQWHEAVMFFAILLLERIGRMV